MGMTLMQRRFADNYIETGNAAQSAIKAGYSPRGAKQKGNQLLNTPDVKIYVNACLEQLESEKTATLEEVIQFYTAVLRGEVKDQFGLDPSVQDRLKAADALMKRFNIADIRESNTMTKLDYLLKEFTDAVNKNA